MVYPSSNANLNTSFTGSSQQSGVHAPHHDALATEVNAIETDLLPGGALRTTIDGKAPAVHTHVEGDVTSLATDLAARELAANKGAANGYAGLDANGKLIPTLPYGSGLRRTFDSFCTSGNGKAAASPTLASQTTAWNAAIAWSKSVGGGMIEFESGLYPHLPALELQMYMGIEGAGMFATRLQIDSTVTSHFVFPHVATTTTVTANSTSASATLTGVSSTAGLAAGMSISGPGVAANTIIQSVTVNTIVLGANASSTNTAGTYTIYLTPNAVGTSVKNLWLDCSQMAGWSTAPYDAINFTMNGGGVDGGPLTLPSIFQSETFAVLQNVFIYLAPRHGVNAGSASGCRGAQYWANVQTNSCGVNGFLGPSTDSQMTNCEAAYSRGAGFYIDTGPVIVSNCKAWSSGNGTTGASGQGFYVANTGGGLVINCEAQDNKGAGFENHSQGHVFVCCRADSNSVGSAGTYPGYVIGAIDSIVSSCVALDRNTGATQYQTHGISLTTCAGSHIDLLHFPGFSVPALGSPILSYDGSAGVTAVINNVNAMQKPAFAASFTPDFYAGGIVEPGVLTAALTINAPGNGPYVVGQHVTFILKQDATGGRTVTWNAAYVNTPATNTTANGYTIGRFVYDGTSWVGI